MLRDELVEQPNDLPRALQRYQQRRRWPQATRLVLAAAIRDAFCGGSPESRVMQGGMLAYWRNSAAARSGTLALLSTAEGRPIALLRRTVAVMLRGFIAHVRGPSPRNKDVGAIRIAKSLLVILYRQVRQVLARPAAFPAPPNLPSQNQRGR